MRRELGKSLEGLGENSVLHNEGYLLCPQGKTVIFVAKKANKKIALVARPAQLSLS